MNHAELFWKYVEGKCSPEESVRVKKLLAERPELKKEIDLMKEVQSSLSETETEAPSMRFTQNVMEALPPNFYPPLSAQSLIGPVWKKIFWGSLAASVVVAFFVFFGNSSSGLGIFTPYTEQAVDKVNGVASALPPMEVQFFALTLVSLLTLALVDKLFFSKVNE